MATMPIPTEEQSIIIEALVKGENVSVNAVAGSGKTTIIMLYASRCPNKKILQVTYNKRLKNEVATKIEKYGITNMRVNTYHGLMYEYYTRDTKGFTDDIMQQLLDEGTGTSYPIPLYHCIVIDEIQDLSMLYYKFMNKFIGDMFLEAQKCPPSLIGMNVTDNLFGTNSDFSYYSNNDNGLQLMIAGDKNQKIYSFKGADHRYLTKANLVWSHICGSITEYPLTTSYRVPHKIAWFVNNVMLGEHRITPVRNIETPVIRFFKGDGIKTYPTKKKSGEKDYSNVCTLCCPMDDHVTDSIPNSILCLEHKIILRIKNKLDSDEYAPGDIFVLMPSVASSKHISKKLENMLVKDGIMCFTPPSDSSQVSHNASEGKIAFGTMHQSKGCERKMVILYDFDMAYYDYYARNSRQDVCPDIWYVAATRASEELIIISSCSVCNMPSGDVSNDACKCLPFINKKVIPNAIAKGFIYEENNGKYKSKKVAFVPQHKVMPSVIVKDVNYDRYGKELAALFGVTCEPDDVIPIKDDHKMTGGHVECVSDISGTIIPVMYAYYVRGIKSLDPKTIARMIIKDIPLGGNQSGDDIYSGVIDFITLKTDTIPPKAYSRIKKQCISNAIKIIYKLREWIEDVRSDKKIALTKWLKLGIINACANDGTLARLRQVNKYDWLTLNAVKKCFERLNKLPPNVKWETFYHADINRVHTCVNDSTKYFEELPEDDISFVDTEEGKSFMYKCAQPGCLKKFCPNCGDVVSTWVCINGFIDAENDDHVWELKCTSTLTSEHMMQLLIYALMTGFSKQSYILYNIKTGEERVMTADKFALAKDLVMRFIHDKFHPPEVSDDDCFVNDCIKALKEIKLFDSIRSLSG